MKKIAISSKGQSLDSKVSPALGVCPYLCIVEYDQGQIDNYKVLQNPATKKGCSGLNAAKTLVNEGIEALIVQHIGSCSFNYLNNHGVDVYQTQTFGKIKDVVVDYFNNNLLQLNKANSGGSKCGPGRRNKGNCQGGCYGPGYGQGKNRGAGKGRNKP